MKKTILIIDDDSRNIFALSAILKARGFPTLSATCMNEGFKILQAGKNIACILMDMMMPDMDGYEAIPKLKEDQRFKHIPIIAVTSQAMTGDREKCLAVGADDYVSKPVEIDKLVALLKQVIDEK